MRRTLYLTGFIILLIIQSHNAQESNKKKILYQARVHTQMNQTYKGFIKTSADTALLITSNPYDEDAIKFIRAIDPSAIDRISVRRKGSVWKGFVSGAVVGFITGVIYGYTDEQSLFPKEVAALFVGIAGFPPGSLLGGLIGSIKLKIPIGGSTLKYKKEFKQILERGY